MRSRRHIGLPGGLALAAALLGAGCGSEGARQVDRVVVIGLDGVDWKVLGPSIRSGSTPHLARFIARGASGELATLPPRIARTYSPIIWASVATGKVPAKHGITGFGRSRDGRIEHTVPYTSNSRRAKALWNILGDRGLRVAVLGWWTTWPAERVNGVMVSDRLHYTRMNLWFGLPRYGEDLPGQTYPPELLDEVAGLAADPAGLRRDFFARFRPGEKPRALEADLHDPWYELFLAYARDEAYRRVLAHVLGGDRYDFLAYYLNGTDIASHYFWKDRFPDEWPEPIPAQELRERGDVIERYYSYVDESIAPLLDEADESCLVIVLSDHGFVTGARGDSPNISGTHYRSAPPGFIAMAGGPVPAGARIEHASVLDVAPTVLHALGLAVARDMDGRVLGPLAPPPGDLSHAVAYVESYEGKGTAADHEPIPTEHDEAILEKLEALGYLGSPDAIDRPTAEAGR